MARKVVLITGGSRGIGEACVRLFAQKGDTVVFFCRNQVEKAEALTRELRQAGMDVAFHQVDVSDSQQVRQAVKKVLDTYHHIDVLVNNAGISHVGLMTDMTDEEWQTLLGVNISGVFYACREVLPGMISRRSGAIVNVSSMWGEVGASCEVAYSATKAAVIGLTKALAKEVGPSGVRVNCITPGVIDTDMNRALTAEDRAALADETPLCRIGTPEETARAVAFLAGEDAAFITGQVLGVSGGLVI
ncbi:MAG: SDR family oxidoreductase [Clostridiales bacterium]|nr:SDR family oxidoreductase [Clostridiales bacterium]